MDAIEEVKERLAIEDVIGEYLTLKRAGRNLRGLSPFTNEKTPSFMVSPEKQIWHDFSSNKGGNIFSFIMEIEGLDFKGALELLAKKAGVELDRSGHSRRGPDKQRLYDALDAAAKFYQVQLKANRDALNYVLKTRGFSKDTVIRWRFGYSPNNGRALADYLIRKGYSELEIQAAGLLTGRGVRKSDMFRGRLMIPLADPQGQIIGFTARLLNNDGFGPKYINTPQTVLYDKSRHVFGLDQAKTAIRESRFVLITEGNLDVVASHQAGVRQTVATAGTAMTTHHLKALSRFTSDIRLCFDNDRAGLEATERAIQLAGELALSLNIVDLSDSKDPDELIKQSPALWRQAVEHSQYALDWLIKRQEKQFDLDSAEGKRRFSDVMLPVIANLSDPVEQDHYMNLLAGKLGVARQALDNKLQAAKPSSFRRLKTKATPVTLAADQIEAVKVEDRLLCLAMAKPQLKRFLKPLTGEMFTRPVASSLLAALQNQSATTDTVEPDYVKIEVLQYEELYKGLEDIELEYEAARLQARLIEQFVKRQKQTITQAMERADEPKVEQLLKQVRRLDELLKLSLGGAND